MCWEYRHVASAVAAKYRHARSGHLDQVIGRNRSSPPQLVANGRSDDSLAGVCADVRSHLETAPDSTAKGHPAVQQRPDLTARITTDDVGDVIVAITGEPVDGTITVDRASAWDELTDLATKTSRPLTVRTIDEHGRSYRDVVEPAPADLARPEPVTPDIVTPELDAPGVLSDAGPAASPVPVPVPAAMKPLADYLVGKAEPQTTAAFSNAVSDDSEHPASAQESGVGDTSWRGPVEPFRAATVRAGRRGGRALSGEGHDRASRVSAPMAITVAVLVVCAGAAGVAAVASDDGQAGGDAAAAAQLPAGVAPPGFMLADGWRSEVAEGTSPAVTAHGRVALHGSDGLMRLVDPATGEIAWSGPAGDGAGSPWTDQLWGSDAIIWRQPGRLLVASPARSEPAVYETAPGARISKAGTAVLVTDPDKPGRVRVLTEAGLVEVDIPDGTVAMAAVRGDVVSSDGLPRLWRTPVTGGDARHVDLTGPDGMVLRRWAGAAGETVTVVWTAPGATAAVDSAVVTTHDSTSGEPLASTTTTWGQVDDEPYTAADGRDPVTAAVGPIVLPLAGKRKPLVDPGTRWLHHVDSRVWGIRDDSTAVVFDRDGVVTVLADGIRLPTHALPDGWAVTTDGAVVAALAPSNDRAES